MSDDVLRGKRVLVVEDEYLIAVDLSQALIAAGAEIVGPLPTVTEALECVDTGSAIDVAILDVNLHGDMVFPVADALDARGVPFVFATGYDKWSLPERFAKTAKFEKPLKMQNLAAAIAPLLNPS